MALQRELLTNGSVEIDHYYLCNYVPLTIGKDGLSRSLLRFKSRLEIDLSAWVECSVEVLTPLVPEGCVIVRALSHEERVNTFSALDHIGVKLSKAMNCSYEPMQLKKCKDAPALKTLNRADRSKALKDIYQFSVPDKTNPTHILILDDILTTGATVVAIAEAIHDKLPAANIKVFTLARVDYNLQMNEQITFEGEYFQWHTDGWEVKEEEVEYNSLIELKRKIMTDSFNPIVTYRKTNKLL